MQQCGKTESIGKIMLKYHLRTLTSIINSHKVE